MITVAISLVFLMGMAAIAVDLGLGFNERRQDQTAADLSVMAGAVDSVLGGSQESIVTTILDIAQANLDTVYTPGEWQTLWQDCKDPDRVDFDVGIGPLVTFQPMQEPIAWGGGELECISSVSSYLRVRIPDQLQGAAFARVIGFYDLTTFAAAVALIEPGATFGTIKPFGIPGGTPNGEICLKSSGSGPAIEPCQGPSGGGFGEIDSEFFGDFFGSPDCGLPGATELAQNIALGIDHAVSTWANPGGVALGSVHPGDVIVGAYDEIGFDACRIMGGVLQPEFSGHVTPPNTMRVATGFSPASVEAGLVSNQTFVGADSVVYPSLLQQGGNPTRDIVKKRVGGIEVIYQLDNKGLWDYLNNKNMVSGLPECNGNAYKPVALTIEEKVVKMNICLAGYNGAGTVTDLFKPEIADSPRLIWAPEYWHAPSTSGKSWQPIQGFRLVFVAGTFFNCTAIDCGVVFYPDLSGPNPEMCDQSGPICQELSLSQLSAFLLPFEALPGDSIPPFPGAESPFVTSLFK